jgi:hypothetical protein
MLLSVPPPVIAVGLLPAVTHPQSSNRPSLLQSCWPGNPRRMRENAHKNCKTCSARQFSPAEFSRHGGCPLPAGTREWGKSGQSFISPSTPTYIANLPPGQILGQPDKPNKGTSIMISLLQPDDLRGHNVQIYNLPDNNIIVN